MRGQPQANPRDSRGGAFAQARKRRGFTFAEILATMVFVAILIPVAVRGVMVANRAGLAADHKRTAAQLAERVLNEMVVTDSWQTSEREGDFEEEYPGYRWSLLDETWSEDSLRVVTVEVFYTVQGNEYSVQLSTLVDETEDDETEQQTQQGQTQ